MRKTHRKADAGSASLNKLTADRLIAKLQAGLRVLDDQVHVAKLEVQNRQLPKDWQWPADLEAAYTTIRAVTLELRGRSARQILEATGRYSKW